MPSKRKRSASGPVVKRRVGAAPKRADASKTAAQDAGTANAIEGAPRQAGVTQPLDAAPAPLRPATPPPADEMPTGFAPSAPSNDAEPAAALRDEARTAPLMGDTPDGSSDDAAAESLGGGAAYAESDEALGPTDGAEEELASETADAPTVRPAGASETSEGQGKTTKRKSTRHERRRDRKKAKADRRAQLSTTQRVLRVVRTLLIVVAILAVITVGSAAAGISYHRWYAYDDALDIQGTWYVSGTDAPVEITADTIVLTDDVAYHYKLDPSSKTITFTFGNLSGEGHYRFSLDRQYLVIFDGSYSWEQSLSTDVSWLIDALMDHLMESPNDLAQGAFYNVTLLSRTSGEDSSVSASVVTTPEGPRVVWSAADADNDGAIDDAAAGGSASGSEDAGSDVDSLLGNLSDKPAG